MWEKKKSVFFVSGLKNVENLGNASRFVKQDIPAVTQPGRSAWAAVLVTLCFGESAAGRISSGAETSSSFTSWSSGADEHRISWQLEHGGVQRAASGSRAAGLLNARRNCFAPLAMLTGMFLVSVGYWSDWTITCHLQWCYCTLTTLVRVESDTETS